MKTIFTMLLFVGLTTFVQAASEINKSLIGGLAIKGYDPVAYFTEGKPVKGDKAYTHSWKDANWRFSSSENRDLFITAPEKYAPQYGGYCAYAVSQNATANIDPEQFTVLDGKLYLNYNKKINLKWTGKRAEYIALANKYWPGLKEK